MELGRTEVLLRAGQMTELDAGRTEVWNKAAIAVQSRFHTHVAREQFHATNDIEQNKMQVPPLKTYGAFYTISYYREIRYVMLML